MPVLVPVLGRRTRNAECTTKKSGQDGGSRRESLLRVCGRCHSRVADYVPAGDAHMRARTHTHSQGRLECLTILLRIYLSSSEKERVGERWREGRPQVWERGGRRWADMTGSTRRCGSGPTSTRMLAKSSYTESASSLVYWSVLCTSTKSVYLMHSNIVTTRKSWYRRLLPGIYSQFHVPSSRTSDGHVRCFANPRE